MLQLNSSNLKTQHYGSYRSTHHEHALHVPGCRILAFPWGNPDLHEKIPRYPCRTIGWSTVFHRGLRLLLPVLGYKKRRGSQPVLVPPVAEYELRFYQLRVDMALARSRQAGTGVVHTHHRLLVHDLVAQSNFRNRIRHDIHFKRNGSLSRDHGPHPFRGIRHTLYSQHQNNRSGQEDQHPVDTRDRDTRAVCLGIRASDNRNT